MKKDPSNIKTLKSASKMSIAIMFSRIFGLIREQVFAFMFGAGAAMDAFSIAFRIPNLIRGICAEGATNSIFIPIFVKVRESEGKRRAFRIAGLTFRIFFIIVLFLSIIGIIFSEELVYFIASSFKDHPGKFELTIRLTKILFLFMPFISLASLFMAVLNSCGVFFLPAFSSALFNITSILTGLIFVFLSESLGFSKIEGMAYGVIIGVIIQAFCQIPSLSKKGYHFKTLSSDPVWYKEESLKKMLFLMIPVSLSFASLQINNVVHSILAASCENGAISWLHYAFRLMQLPLGVFGISIAAASLPEISRFFSIKDYKSSKELMEVSIKRVFAISIPASIGLIVLSYPITELIYEYGNFTQNDTKNVSISLIGYSIGIVAYGSCTLLRQSFYASSSPRFAIISSGASVILNILISLFMVKHFSFLGLAISSSIASIFEMTLLYVFFQRMMIKNKSKPIESKKLVLSFFTHIFISIIMVISIYFTDFIIFDEFLTNIDGILKRVLRVSILVTQGVLIVVLLSKFLRVSETMELIKMIKSKF